LVAAVQAREFPPPIHFVSGVGTTLLDLAKIASSHVAVPPVIELGPERSFDVARFIGNPDRAARILRWRTTVPITSGMPRLIEAMRTTSKDSSVNHRG
jgi:UDP-glucose 4-epimerase